MDQQLAHEAVSLSMWQVLKLFIYKHSQPTIKKAIPESKQTTIPEGVSVNHIAVVLDGEVQETLMLENKLAALLLSKPKFIQFDPHVVRPLIGWKYKAGVFEIPEHTHEH
jgi:alcohol dehydrogenase YqhD (iron-dependent ADH family)